MSTADRPAPPAGARVKPPASSWRWPDFIGIGVPKSGTTWLHANLSSHPSIWLPQFKEIQYFNGLYVAGHEWTRQYRRGQVGQAIIDHIKGKAPDQLDFEHLQRLIELVGDPPDDEWYGRIFAHAPADRLCGEITPDYCVLPDAGIAHLLRFNPRVKVILLLRDPIARTWSDIKMALRQEEYASMTLDAIWSLPAIHEFDNYNNIIERWRSHCHSGNLLVTFLDHIAAAPYVVLENVCRFLQVPFDPGFFPRARDPVHVGQHADMPAGFYETMRNHYRDVMRDLAATFPDPCAQWVRAHFADAPRQDY